MTCVFLSHFIFFHGFPRLWGDFPIFSAQDRRPSCVIEAEETEFVRGIRSRLQGRKINTDKISGVHIGSSWQNQKLRIPWAALPPAVYWCTITNPRSSRSRISESFSFLLIGRGRTKASVGKLDTFGDYPVGSDCAIRVIVAQVLHSIVLMVQLKDKWRLRKWSSIRLAQMLQHAEQWRKHSVSGNYSRSLKLPPILVFFALRFSFFTCKAASTRPFTDAVFRRTFLQKFSYS